MSETKKVLIVEDEPAIAELLGEFCHLLGFEFKILNYGADVLPTVKSYRPDLVTLDLILPDISGVDVLEQLRGDDEARNTPVIVISSIAEDSDVRSLLNDCRAIMTKPFQSSALKKNIEQILAQKTAAV